MGALFCVATGAYALPNTPSERLRAFADCAGRFSALEEHQRLFDGPLSAQTARQVQFLNDLIAAMLPDAQETGREVLSWRIDAKFAQAALLQQAVFGTDNRRANRAQVLATQYIQGCRSLLPGV
ncbi:hypothetical protein ACMU_13695 [Actibacterium mucosum KCTC 23349]|uniref:Uncharacterized protein n=1 Tax=Actibacterium mucosum KCTC 23349 TaxID=1454373 RepID=A0A037ZGZ9_9RHOB|nr:hypothetical protein [Actibacterium mucosum]KAJ55735.1 hypothetical protein ACMU_13695 [Actibacterium mucosum KCTC 23349]